jgi:hypothetical protein
LIILEIFNKKRGLEVTISRVNIALKEVSTFTYTYHKASYTFFTSYTIISSMGYDFDSSDQQGIAGKKLVIIFALAIIGAIFFIQFLFGFPLNELIRENITEEAKVVTKNDSICVIETSDHPRTISDCKYHVGDLLTVTYKNGTEPIEKHELRRLS